MINFKKLLGLVAGTITFLGIPQFYMQWTDYQREHGGNLSMLLMNHNINNNDERTIFICMSDPREELTGVCITPTFDNSSQFTIKDFDLRFNLETTGFLPPANMFYDRIDFDKTTCQYKYQEKDLPQFSQTYEPFRLSSLPKENSRYTIRAKATYSNAPHPFIYTVYVWVRIVPRHLNQSLEDWKMSCKEVIYKANVKSDTYDILYCFGKDVYYEYGKDFGASYSVAVDERKTEENDFASDNQIVQNQRVRITQEQKRVIDNKNALTQKSTLSNRETQQSDATSETIRIANYERILVNDTAYLELIFNQLIQANKRYLIAFYKEKPRRGYGEMMFYGNGGNSVRVRLYNNVDDITHVCIPVQNDSLKEDIEFKEQNGYLRITNTSSEVVTIDLKYKNVVQSLHTIDKGSYVSIRGIKVSDITSYETYLVPQRPLGWCDWCDYEEEWAIGLFILLLSMGLGLTWVGIEELFKSMGKGKGSYSEFLGLLFLGLLLFIGALVFFLYRVDYL